MKNLKNLIKIYIKQVTLPQKGFGNKNVKNTKTKTLTVALLWLLIGAAFGYYSYTIAKSAMLVSVSVLPFAGMITGVLFLTAFMIYEINALMYSKKDYEILSALPIPSSQIITAKIITSYLLALGGMLVVFLPFMILYFINVGVTALSIITTIISILFAPIIIICLACVCCFLINLITCKLKNRLKVASAIQLVLLVGIMLLINFTPNFLYPKVANLNMPVWVGIVFFPASLIQLVIVNKLWAYIFAFIAISLVFGLISVYILSKTYYKINSSLIGVKINKRKKPIKFKKKNVFTVLFLNEAKRYFGCGIWFMNSFIGVLLMLILSFSLGLAKMPEELFGVQNLIYVATAIFTLSMSATTSVSINMEGNKFITNKSLPISFNQIVLSKVLFNIVLIMPFAIIGAIVFSVGNYIGALNLVLLLTTIILEVLATSVLGILINLCLPKLNWVNEMVAVKQCASLAVYLVIVMLIAFLPMGIMFAVDKTMQLISLNVIYYIYIGIFSAVFITATPLVFTLGKTKYNKMG